MNMFIHAQVLGVEQMGDTIEPRFQNKIVNRSTTLYNFEYAE
jgi:hypothetical protein